jgi:hypothetical protein
MQMDGETNIHTERQTAVIKITGAFSNCVNTPKN